MVETATDTVFRVNWSGGGDIKPDDVKEWDIEHLTRVAMDFPDKVAACKCFSSFLYHNEF